MTETETRIQTLEAELVAARQATAKAEHDARELTNQLQGVNDEVVRLNRELQDSVAKMRDFQDELSKSSMLSELGRLTSTISHDIRNPLGSIRTSAFIVERQVKDAAPNAMKPLERIKKGVDRCDVIINELLDFARSKTLNLEKLNFDDWVMQAIAEHKGNAIQAVVVETDLGLNGAECAFDPSRMDRAFVNLLTNAAEAMVGKEGSPIENPTANPKSLSLRGVAIAV